MALPRMPTRDPDRSQQEPQHARGYDPATGGWTQPATDGATTPLTAADARTMDDVAAARARLPK